MNTTAEETRQEQQKSDKQLESKASYNLKTPNSEQNLLDMGAEKRSVWNIHKINLPYRNPTKRQQPK
jgi:hypothetical protein